MRVVGVQIKKTIHCYMNKPHRLGRTESMLDTLATFHLLMSSLNVDAPANRPAMRVTAAVFQSAIGPYVVAAYHGSVSHLFVAEWMLKLVMSVSAATRAGRKRSSARPARRCDRNAPAHLHRKRHLSPEPHGRRIYFDATFAKRCVDATHCNVHHFNVLAATTSCHTGHLRNMFPPRRGASCNTERLVATLTSRQRRPACLGPW
jgi:hypothetical protein